MQLISRGREKYFDYDIGKEHFSGIVPFMATQLKGRFFVFLTVDFLLFIASAGGSNPAGQIA